MRRHTLLVVVADGLRLRFLGRVGCVARDELRHDAIKRLDTEGQRPDVQEMDVVYVAVYMLAPV
jgi:hypothetical protein